MDEITIKNREALYCWAVRCWHYQQGLTTFPAPWPRMHMAVLDRVYLEKRLAARRWLAARHQTILQYNLDNIIDMKAFARRRRGY